TGLDGKVAVNPSGGLIAQGHPVGATGCAQVYELVRQLRGEAANQVRHAEVALAHNLGGTGVVSTVTILGRLRRSRPVAAPAAARSRSIGDAPAPRAAPPTAATSPSRGAAGSSRGR